MSSGRRIALLDLDGTLTDPRDGILRCLRAAFAAVDRPAPPERELLGWIGPPLAASFEAALGCPEAAGEALRAYRACFDESGWRANRPVAGIDTALTDLADGGFDCYVATSKPLVFARRIVSHFRLDRWISDVFGSEFDGTRADKAELIAHALGELDAPAASTVMVGDRHHDAAGAEACAVPCVGVLWGFGDRGELEAAGASAIAVHPGQLAEACLDALFNARRATAR